MAEAGASEPGTGASPDFQAAVENHPWAVSRTPGPRSPCR